MFIKRAIEKKPLVIFGDGRQTRDYVHVSDIVKAHMAVKDDWVGVWNLSSGVETSIQELATLVNKLTDSAAGVVFQDVREGEASTLQPERVRLAGELSEFCLDPTRAARAFWDGEKVRLEEGVRREVDWAKSNPEAWRTPPRV